MTLSELLRVCSHSHGELIDRAQLYKPRPAHPPLLTVPVTVLWTFARLFHFCRHTPSPSFFMTDSDFEIVLTSGVSFHVCRSVRFAYASASLPSSSRSPLRHSWLGYFLSHMVSPSAFSSSEIEQGGAPRRSSLPQPCCC